jgi:hypothetical protein
MNHQILQDKIRKAMGGKPPIQARDRWADFIRTRGTRFVLRYEWIRDRRFFKWVWDNQDTLDIEDGEEWFGVYIWKG